VQCHVLTNGIATEKHRGALGVVARECRLQFTRSRANGGRSVVWARALLEVRGELVRRRTHLGRQLRAEMSAVPVIDPANALAVLDVDRGEEANLAAKQFRRISEGH